MNVLRAQGKAVVKGKSLMMRSLHLKVVKYTLWEGEVHPESLPIFLLTEDVFTQRFLYYILFG